MGRSLLSQVLEDDVDDQRPLDVPEHRFCRGVQLAERRLSQLAYITADTAVSKRRYELRELVEFVGNLRELHAEGLADEVADRRVIVPRPVLGLLRNERHEAFSPNSEQKNTKKPPVAGELWVGTPDYRRQLLKTNSPSRATRLQFFKDPMQTAMRAHMNAPRKQPTILQQPAASKSIGFARCFMLLCAVAVSQRFVATIGASACVSHWKQMWDEGIMLKAKLFATPASDHATLHVTLQNTTTDIEVCASTGPALGPVTDQLVGSEFSLHASPVRFGSNEPRADSAAGDAGGGGSIRRRRSVPSNQCLGCGRGFSSEQALFAHGPQCNVVPEEEEEPRQNPEDANDNLAEGVAKIQIGFAESAADIKYGGYGSNANVQRSKHAVRDVAELQQEVLLQELASRDLTGTDWKDEFADVIETVMSATDPLMGRDAEHRFLEKQQPYQVKPVCVTHPVPAQTTTVGGRTLPDTNGFQTWNIPIERSIKHTSNWPHTHPPTHPPTNLLNTRRTHAHRSWQRNLLYDPTFAKHFVDWGQLPRSPEGTYADIQDGLAARNHPELGNTTYDGPSRLAGGHYFDDMETTVPIGVFRGKSKVSLHYVVLLNQPGHVRGNLDYIFLTSVTLSSTQHKVGIDTIVSGPKGESVEEGSSIGASFRRLHRPQGINFQVPRVDGPGFETKPFRGWLLLASADRLGGAELLGTKRSFGPAVKCPCWQCDARNKKHMRRANSFEEPGRQSFTRRTDQIYQDQCAFAQTLPENRPPKPKPPRLPPGAPKPPKPPPPPRCTHGSTCTCTRAQYLNSVGISTLDHAYVRIPLFEWAVYVPTDIMHTELEGNLKSHGYGFLYVAIKKYKWFTLAEVNAALRVPLPATGEVLPPIRETALKGRKGTLPRAGGTLVYSAGQMIAFALASPELFRSLMPHHALQSSHWRAWLAHVKYFTAMMQPSFTDSSIRQLDGLIYRAQTLFLQIPDYSNLWKFKNHIAQHVPYDIKLFGPPRFYWCMRFEAKNQEFKKASKLTNYQNMPKSLAEFHVGRVSHRLRTNACKLSSGVELGNILVCEELDPTLSEEHESLAELVDVGDGSIVEVSWLSSITYAGHTLVPGTWIQISDVEGFSYLAQVQALGTTSDGMTFVYTHTFDLAVILHDDPIDDSQFAWESELLQEVSMAERTFDLDTLHSLTLLMAFLFDGRRRFVAYH